MKKRGPEGTTLNVHMAGNGRRPSLGLAHPQGPKVLPVANHPGSPRYLVVCGDC
jgi:hypothetical protein